MAVQHAAPPARTNAAGPFRGRRSNRSVHGADRIRHYRNRLVRRHSRRGLRGASAGESAAHRRDAAGAPEGRSEEHTSELQSHLNLVCRLLLEKKKNSTRSTAVTTTPGWSAT